MLRVDEEEDTTAPKDTNTEDTPKLRKAKKIKRKSDSAILSPTKMKKLKLVLGSETMSTVNYSE